MKIYHYWLYSTKFDYDLLHRASQKSSQAEASFWKHVAPEPRLNLALTSGEWLPGWGDNIVQITFEIFIFSHFCQKNPLDSIYTS